METHWYLSSLSSVLTMYYKIPKIKIKILVSLWLNTEVDGHPTINVTNAGCADDLAIIVDLLKDVTAFLHNIVKQPWKLNFFSIHTKLNSKNNQQAWKVQTKKNIKQETSCISGATYASQAWCQCETWKCLGSSKQHGQNLEIQSSW